MVYQGDTEAERELVFVHHKFVQELERIIPSAGYLAKELSKNKLTVGETRVRLLALFDSIESLLTLLGRALAIFNQLAEHIKSTNTIQLKWGSVDLLFYHLTGTKALIKHHLD